MSLGSRRLTAVCTAIIVSVGISSVPARAEAPVNSIGFRLVGSDGQPAPKAIVFVTVPGPGHRLLTLEPTPYGSVDIPVVDLTALALSTELAQRHVNFMVTAYSFDEAPTEPGIYDADTTVIGFVLDTLTGTPTTSPSPDGATYTMHRAQVDLTARTDYNCQEYLTNSAATCEYHQMFDADLQNVPLPFLTNNGGGNDWMSTFVVETSKTIKSEFFIKTQGDRWGRGEGKLTTSEADRATLSSVDSDPIGDVNLGKSQDRFIEWQYVREKVVICGFIVWACSTIHKVRPWEWTGSLPTGPLEVPSYPYDQAGEPSMSNNNCTRRYVEGVTTGVGNDTTLGTTMSFGAEGGFRDEIFVEATWTTSTETTFDLTHKYLIVDPADRNYSMHFLFVPGGLSAVGDDEIGVCPEDNIAEAYSDAADHDLTNLGLGKMPEPNTHVGCPDELPAQLRRIVCE